METQNQIIAKSAIRDTRKLALAYIGVITLFLGATVCIYLTKPSSDSKNQNITQNSKALSLSELTRENGGIVKVINTEEDFDRDGDGQSDNLQQVCSNRNIFYCSSKAVSNNQDECWYPVQGEPTQ